MTYEYRSGNQTLELPNPYLVENQIRFVTGGIWLVAGIALLFVTRDRLLGGWQPSAALPLLSSLVLLTYGVRIVVVALMQLRFFFGRERPQSLTVNLAPLQNGAAGREARIAELPPDTYGALPPAQALTETIRRGALPFAEPTGPLNGLLHRWHRDLIYAVTPLRRDAQDQFHVAVIVTAVGVSLLVSWVLATAATSLQWLTLGYFVLTTSVVLKSLRSGSSPAERPERLPVLLIVTAILAPVAFALIGPALPSLGGLRPFGATLFLLVSAGIAATLFFAALRAQLGPPPPASSSVHQVALSMNCHPAQLSEELARTLQTQWWEQIPNRRYLALQPQINTTAQGSGSFVSEVLEETQPSPVSSKLPGSLAECLDDSPRRPVLFLQLYGACLLVVTAICLTALAWWYTPDRLARNPANLLNLLVYVAGGFVIGRYCFTGAHKLFGRFDFDSLVYWVECRGNYQVASANFGNVISDRLHTQKSLINIETATLRVWLVELQSVVFGKDGRRYIRAMIGKKDEAQALAEHLIAFAGNQSVIVAPTAREDADKVASMARLATAAAGVAALEAAAGALVGPDGTPKGVQKGS